MSQYDRMFDLKIFVEHCERYFMGQWFCLIARRLFDIWTSCFGIMSQYDRMFDLIIFVEHCDLYFMVQWFCLVSWTLFSGWTSYFLSMNQYDPTFDLKINVGHCDLYFMVQWLMNIIIGIMDQCNTRLTLSSICRSVTYIFWSSDFVSYHEDYLMEKCTWDNESVWHKDWPLRIYVGQWPIIHGPLSLPSVIVIDLNYLYTLRNGAGRGYSCPSRHLL